MRYVEAFGDGKQSLHFKEESGRDLYLTREQWYYKNNSGEKAIFMAGGISNCADWQYNLINQMIEDRNGAFNNLVVINPRRANFNVNDPSESVRQIEWEHAHLKSADIVLFWFCEETLCPITLLEYGKLLVSKKPLIVGCHPNYKRKIDVEVQTRLERPSQKIYDSLDDMALEVYWTLKRGG